jgi:hypothetical protein
LILSVVEQRLDAVRAVLAGATVTEVAAMTGGVAVEFASLDRPVISLEMSPGWRTGRTALFGQRGSGA